MDIDSAILEAIKSGEENYNMTLYRNLLIYLIPREQMELYIKIHDMILNKDKKIEDFNIKNCKLNACYNKKENCFKFHLVSCSNNSVNMNMLNYIITIIESIEMEVINVEGDKIMDIYCKMSDDPFFNKLGFIKIKRYIEFLKERETTRNEFINKRFNKK